MTDEEYNRLEVFVGRRIMGPNFDMVRTIMLELRAIGALRIPETWDKEKSDAGQDDTPEGGGDGAAHEAGLHGNR